MNRQKLTGWLIIAVAGAWLVYFLKTRLFTAGPPLTKQEWIYAFSSLGLLVLGTVNVRMAAARERGHKVKL